MATNGQATKPVCVVVGVKASSPEEAGIGQAFATKFAEEGYQVAMLARSDLSTLESQIPGSKAFVCDCTNEESIRSAVEAIETQLGPIDVLLYNAGNMVWKKTLDLTAQDFQQAFDINVKGLFFFSQLLAPKMIARGSGSIGVTGATASWRGIATTPAFAAAKMGQRGLVESMVRDFSPQGVHVFLMVLDGQVGHAEGKVDPNSVAWQAHSLVTQPKGAWTWETHLYAPKADGIMTI